MPDANDRGRRSVAHHRRAAGGGAPRLERLRRDKELTLTGTITESGYEHPHGHVRLDVPGKVWLVVLAPPTRMESRGLPASKLKVGTKATVVGYPNRSNPDEMRAERITIDGATVELR